MPRSEIVAEMASAAGISTNTVNQILNAGINCPPLERLEGFAEVLDVSVERLIDAAEEDGCEYERGRAMDERLLEIRTVLQRVALPADVGDCPVDAVRHLVDRVQHLEDEVERLRPLADDGHQYRHDLIEETLAEGVRAMGQAFPTESYRAMLEKSSLEHIKAVRDSFRERAAQRFPGGKQTVDDDSMRDNGHGQGDEWTVPDVAYTG